MNKRLIIFSGLLFIIFSLINTGSLFSTGIQPTLTQVTDSLGHIQTNSWGKNTGGGWPGSVTTPIVVNVGSTITFTATASDPDGKPLQYKFCKMAEGGCPVIQDWSNSNTYTWNVTNEFIGPNIGVMVCVKNNDGVEWLGSYNGDDYTYCLYKVVSSSIKSPPIAEAGSNQIADANETITLDGSSSKANSGNITNYNWNRLPDNIVLYSGQQPTYKTKALGRVEEVIQLTVTDNNGGTATDTMSILNKKIFSIAPSAPSNLVLAPISSSQINLAWNDNSNNENGFVLECSTSASGPFTPMNVSANVTVYSDTGLATNATYYYRIKAYNGVGDSSYSNVANATTLAQAMPPTAPSSLVATVASSTQINLSWVDNSNNEDGFAIERSLDNSNFSQITTKAANVTTYNDTGLTAGTTYYYRVKAYNAIGSVGYSNVANATTVALPAPVVVPPAAPVTPPAAPVTPPAAPVTPPVVSVTPPVVPVTPPVVPVTPPPVAPVGLAVTASRVDLTTDKVVLNWYESSTSLGGFTIQRAANSAFTSGLTTFAVGATVRTYTDTPIARRTICYYRVQAFNAAGSSAWSASVAVTAP
jgi:hypothetical protein